MNIIVFKQFCILGLKLSWLLPTSHPFLDLNAQYMLYSFTHTSAALTHSHTHHPSNHNHEVQIGWFTHAWSVVMIPHPAPTVSHLTCDCTKL